MDVLRVKLNGYKNLVNVNVIFNKITSLVSVNNYGKSNFLTGLVFGLRFIKETSEAKTMMMRQHNFKPLNKHNMNDCFSLELEFMYHSQIVKYSYSFDWEKEKIINEYLYVKEDSQKFTNYIKREEEAYYRTSVTGSCNKKIKIDNNELIINKLKAFDDLFYYEIVKEINQIEMYIDRHFDANRSYGFMYVNRNAKYDLKYNLANDNNIPMILYDIKQVYPDKYALIINTFKSLFPNIKDMEVVEAEAKMNKGPQEVMVGKFYTIAVMDSNVNQPVNFDLMSDGTRKILLVLTNLILAEINHYSLVAIEEPENSLNPKILQEYLITLNNFVDDVKIIITSHSPYLVNYLPPNDIYIGMPNDRGLAIFLKVKDNMLNKLLSDADKLNMYVGDYMFDLMSSGSEEMRQIEKYVE